MTRALQLTDEERAMLAGEQGEAVRRAMQIVMTLGRIYGAERLLPVQSVQVAGVSYRNLGEASLDFLRDWAAEGAHVRVPTTLNPAGMDLCAWQHMGISEAFARKQRETVDIYTAMGIEPTCTCTPYLIGNLPGYGEHIAWSESSAISFANSVLGARTNREGGPSALAAAICGRTAAYGFHLDEGRRATLRVEVRCPIRSAHEFAALGYWVGREAGDAVPYFVGLELPRVTRALLEADSGPAAEARDALKLLGAAMAASGAVALYHVAGVTPEACAVADICPPNVPTLRVDSLELAFAALNAPVRDIDLVVIGCPHASLNELRQVAEGLRGQRLHSALWVTVARAVREQAEALGLVQTIEGAGGQVVADGCVIVAPMHDLPYHTLATNSAKMACYALPHAGLQVRFGALGDCLHAAVAGYWDGEDAPVAPRRGIMDTSLRGVAAKAADSQQLSAGTALHGHVVVAGHAQGLALVSDKPISFLGGIDPATGVVLEKGHPLEGRSVAGRVLVFPYGKGSTVGSYVLYRLAKAGLAPKAIINAQSEPIVAVGALISGIPMLDQVDIAGLRTGMHVVLDEEVVHIE
jgi:predicted aconitase/predicted aconitase with swiveling domain